MLQRSPAVVLVDRGREANEPPACRTHQHGIGTSRRGGTSGILRIASVQLRAVCTARPARGTGREVLRDGWGAWPLQWYGPSVVFPGECRNGRRAGFRCQCPSGRGGSSPPSPTV